MSPGTLMFLKGHLGQETVEATNVSSCQSKWLETPVEGRLSFPSVRGKLHSVILWRQKTKVGQVFISLLWLTQGCFGSSCWIAFISTILLYYKTTLIHFSSLTLFCLSQCAWFSSKETQLRGPGHLESEIRGRLGTCWGLSLAFHWCL